MKTHDSSQLASPVVAGTAHNMADPLAYQGGKLLVTVGGSPLPVLISLVALRPVEIHALVTSESVDVWQRMLATYAELLDCEPTDIVATSTRVSGHDLTAIDEVAERVLDTGDWGVSYAGGLAAMSGAVVRQFLRKYDRLDRPAEAVAWYVAEDGDVMSGDRGEVLDVPSAARGVALSLEQMLRLHAAVPVVERFVPEVGVTGDPRNLHHELATLPKRVRPERIMPESDNYQWAVAEALSFCLRAHAACRVYFNQLASIQSEDGTEVQWKLPIAIVNGFHLYLIEAPGFVKNPDWSAGGSQCWRLGALKEKAFTAQYLAHRVGGVHGRSAIVVPKPSAGNLANLSNDFGPDSLPDDLPRGQNPGREPGLPRTHVFGLSDVRESLAAEIAGLVDTTELIEWLGGE